MTRRAKRARNVRETRATTDVKHDEVRKKQTSAVFGLWSKAGSLVQKFVTYRANGGIGGIERGSGGGRLRFNSLGRLDSVLILLVIVHPCACFWMGKCWPAQRNEAGSRSWTAGRTLPR